MDTSMNGKAIRAIWWEGNGDACGEGFVETPLKTLELSATHHGDHDQFWVVCRNKDGVEIERYNVNRITCIDWKKTNE